MIQKILVNSRIPRGESILYDVSKLEYANIVYMCVKEPHKEFQIPENIKDVVSRVVADSMLLGRVDAKDQYCYVTVKRGYIPQGGIGNRDGWHIDGFLSDQENFIWSDCPETPTLVIEGTLEVTKNHPESLKEMEYYGRYARKFKLRSNTLYHLDKECIHKPSENESDKTVLRTFIKVTFSKEIFNGYGNAWNYLIPDIKPTAKRLETRNHAVSY